MTADVSRGQDRPMPTAPEGLSPLPQPPLTRRDRRRNRITAVTVLVSVWVLLWGQLTWVNVIGGLVVALVVLTAFPLPPVTYAGRIRPLGLLRFILRFAADLVVASVQIAVTAFRFGHTPRSAVIAVRLRVTSDLNLTLTANALSLVPGSLIVEVDRTAGILYVHVFGVRTRAEVERFRGGVLDLEARIVRATGSARELRLVAESAGTPPETGAVLPDDPKGG